MTIGRPNKWTGKPRLDGGWFKLSREYHIAVMQADLTGAERRTLDAIIFAAYAAYPPAPDSTVYLTTAQLVAATQLTRRSIERARTALIEYNMLTFQASPKQRSASAYKLQDNYLHWTPPIDPKKVAASATQLTHSNRSEYDTDDVLNGPEYDTDDVLGLACELPETETATKTSKRAEQTTPVGPALLDRILSQKTADEEAHRLADLAACKPTPLLPVRQRDLPVQSPSSSPRRPGSANYSQESRTDER